MNGFYVTDIQEAMLAGMRLDLTETRAYPRNAGLTVEYQLMADPGEMNARIFLARLVAPPPLLTSAISVCYSAKSVSVNLVATSWASSTTVLQEKEMRLSMYSACKSGGSS